LGPIIGGAGLPPSTDALAFAISPVMQYLHVLLAPLQALGSELGSTSTPVDHEV